MSWTEVMKLTTYEIESKLKAEGYIDDPEMNPFVKNETTEVENGRNTSKR